MTKIGVIIVGRVSEETQVSKFKVAVSKGKVSVYNTNSKEILIFDRDKVSLTLIRQSKTEGLERIFGHYADNEDLELISEISFAIAMAKPQLLPIILEFIKR